MLGLLSFLPTIAFMPQELFILAGVYAMFRNPAAITRTFTDLTSKKVKVSPIFIIVALILLFSSLNFLINDADPSVTPRYFPQFVLLPLTVFIASQLKKQDVKVLSILVAFEVVVAIIEYFMGVSTFFTGLKNYEMFDESGLMYNSRPLGLSNNSSILAVKCLLIILLNDFFKNYNSRLDKVMWLLLLVGVYLTFGRTVFVALIVFFSYKAFIWFKSKKPVIDWFYAIVGVVIVVVFATELLIEYHEVIISQFTRNTQKVDLSGREKIWAFYFEFISHNLWFGNASHKVWFGLYHAHSSYLQLIATNGIVISGIYFFMILAFMNRLNFIYLVTILIYSISQYAIFWGISIIDIIFIFFLLNTTQKKNSIPSLEFRQQTK